MAVSVKNEPVRASENEYEFVFPHLVMKELIAALLATIALLIWSIMQNAPLLSIADPNKTENPAKAPWYFVGLQELLVYFDPWIAGVIIPSLIIVGLILIPYLDISKAGIGKYSLRGRKLAITTYGFGFGMWFVLILIGQFLRGPNWQFYWPWEDWSVAKSAEESLVNMPQWAGVVFLLVYAAIGLALPALLMKGVSRKMGAAKYLVAFSLVLLMYAVPIKILLRLAFNIRYILTTPWFNI